MMRPSWCIPKNLFHSRWYSNDIHRLDMVYIMSNFDEVYSPLTISIATWYIYIYIYIYIYVYVVPIILTRELLNL